jgi:hypothetical protein
MGATSTVANPPKITNTAEPFADRLAELEKCDFAGEVSISETELTEIAQVVARELGRAVQTNAMMDRLILLAVNCAYYRTGAQGFWSPFCALLGFEDSQINVAQFRRKIEDALIKRGFRAGPYLQGFRYVTPIRLEAGLTRHDFPAFARLLNAGRARYGWSRMRKMPHAEFVSFVRETVPRTKFTEFLEEVAGGCALTRDVLDDLVRWQQGISAGAKPSPHGYRPGFWDELLPLLDSESPATTAVDASAPEPKFFFDSARAQLGLLFPQDFVNRRYVRLDGETVYESFLARTRLAELEDVYSVEMRTNAEGWQPVELPGWFPSPQVRFALFQLTGEYVPLGSIVPPGSYFLLALDETDAPVGIQCLTSFEYVNLMDATLRFWQVEIREGLDLSALGYRHGAASIPILEWAEAGERLIGTADFSEVYLNELPPIRVRRVSDFQANRLALCYDFGDGISRHTFQGESDTALLRLPIKAPCRGQVWVEALGRVRAPENLVQSRLSFCLLPPCKIRWPRGLYGEEGEPLVSLEADETVKCRFPDCEVLPGPERAWRVPRDQGWVEGELTVGAVRVRVAERIFRAAVEDETGATFLRDRLALNHNAAVRVRGLPGDNVKLRLRTPTEQTADMLLLQHFDRHGVVEACQWDLRDALARIPAAPVVEVDVWGGGWVTTRARIVDLQAVEQWLFNSPREPDPGWLNCWDQSVAYVLRVLARKLDGTREALPWPLPAKFPPSMVEWTTTVLACAWTFSVAEDRPASTVLQAVFENVGPERRRTLEWVLRVEAALRDGADDGGVLCAEYEHLDRMSYWIPWQKRLRDLRARIAADAELSPLIEEWRGDVFAGLREPRSAVGLMQGGRQLTKAFAHQYANRSVEAFRTLSEIPTDAPGIIADLRLLLDYLLRLNFGGTVLLPSEPPTRCHRRLRPLLTGLRILLARQLGEDPPPRTDAAAALQPHILPLRSADAATLQAALDTLSAYPRSQTHAL